jgi:pilus assembly protein CpaB
MNRARIVVLTVAICAGGVAAYLASGSDNSAPPPAPVAQLPTVDVLVAKADIGLGQTLKPDDVQWQTWPTATASAIFIRRSERPDGVTQVTGSIARAPFIQGEPIRDQKLVKAEGSGFMAAILPTGMRAISTEITPETGAGGFILPNDRVDIIRTFRDDESSRAGGVDVHMSETILTNIRVLAIGQNIQERNGEKVVTGETATLELTPAQAEMITLAQKIGHLSLALRSLADANQTQDAPRSDRAESALTVVRYGVAKQSPKR